VQDRYEALTGWKAPAAGDPVARMLRPAQRTQDAIARQTISRELGSSRHQLIDSANTNSSERLFLTGKYPLFLVAMYFTTSPHLDILSRC
jgi:hypothetical protein